MSATAATDVSALPTQSVRAESLLSAPEAVAVSVRAGTRPPVIKRPNRVKAPKDSKIYKSVLAYIALKAQGLTTKEIAEHLGLTYHSLRQYIHHANKRQWLDITKLDMPQDQVDVILASQAVQNIHLVLAERDTIKNEKGEVLFERVSPRASDVALEVAKGVGLLKSHQVVKGDGGLPNVFALKVEVINPGNGQPVVSLREGSCGGAPAYDAEVIDGESV